MGFGTHSHQYLYTAYIIHIAVQRSKILYISWNGNRDYKDRKIANFSNFKVIKIVIAAYLSFEIKKILNWLYG